MKIGLIREWKQPADRRVGLSPALCSLFKTRFPGLNLVVESSPERAFNNSEYEHVGVPVQTDMTDCDILIGIKEVPIDKLIPNKTYMFFSHTIKEQAYNRNLLKAILAKKIQLIDYEPLVWPGNGRILGFGKWAGIVGTYNAFLTWGEKTKQFRLPPAYTTNGFIECMQLLKSIRPNGIKIAFTGNGRVATGIREVLEHMMIRELDPSAYLQTNPEESVFTHLRSEHIYKRKDGSPWNEKHFYEYHNAYEGCFKPFVSTTDILINGMYWEDDMPALFQKSDTSSNDFRIKVIADISCDVEGSVPITVSATDIYNPTYGWSRTKQCKVEKYTEDSIDIMAVANLPTEMPKMASEEFGSHLLHHILPLLINEPDHEIIYKGTITTKEGTLNKPFEYLKEYVESEEL